MPDSPMKKILPFILVGLLASAARAETPLNADQQLIKAATNGDITAVKDLLAHGAKVQARDEHGWTALMAAIR